MKDWDRENELAIIDGEFCLILYYPTLNIGRNKNILMMNGGIYIITKRGWEAVEEFMDMIFSSDEEHYDLRVYYHSGNKVVNQYCDFSKTNVKGNRRTRKTLEKKYYEAVELLIDVYSKVGNEL
ncbi:MAG: hypothetical protein EBR82_81710 [Caulobacteraceae bacterium]|nr:hypothetical protein [Caulobacteraceae bacterium]